MTLFYKMSRMIRDRTGGIGDDIVIQGSRAAGTAIVSSDIDIAIRVSSEKFNELIKLYYKSPNPGTAAERTMLHSIKNGIIHSGECRLSSLRKDIEKILGMEVDISIIRIGGPFDASSFIQLP